MSPRNKISPRALRVRLAPALVFLCTALATPAWAAADFDAWAEGLAARRMRADPVLATTTQYFQGEEQARLDGQWTHVSKAARLDQVAKDRRALDELHGFDRARLTPQQRVSAALIEWTLQQELAAGEFLDDEYVFRQMDGLPAAPINFLSQQHPLRDARDVQSYLERLAALSSLMDEGIERARSAQAQGTLLPRFITEEVIAQFETFLGPRPADNVLVTSLAERMAQIEGLSAEGREAARAKAEKIVADAVLPAWRRGLSLMRAQLPLTNDDAGLWRLRNGDRYYAAVLSNQTSTGYGAAEIHAIGLKQVARIEQEMDGLLRQLGYDEGSVDARFRKLEADQQPKGADPRPELLARYTRILRDAEVRVRPMFNVLPKAPVEVRREPALTEATESPHSTGPAPDGSMPGIFWIPLPGPDFDTVRMRTLTYHETVPGHHLQETIQLEAKELPVYRRTYAFGYGNAYSEGWALYAEQLAIDQGWYEGDTIGRVGQLQQALFRARRLVVDTGLHAMKWTRQQAIDYGMPQAEIDRYVVEAGQACGYTLGRLKIEAIRDKARAALGAKFDIRKFHDAVLLTGNVPLEVLETAIDDWVKAQRG